jgi:hypothetical protein
MKGMIAAAVVAALLLSVPAAAGASETRVYIRFSVGGSLIIGGGILFWSIGTASRVSENVGQTSDSDGLFTSRSAAKPAQKVTSDFPAADAISDEAGDILIAVPFYVFHW